MSDFDFAFVLTILLLMTVVGIASFEYIYLSDTSGDKNTINQDKDWKLKGDVDRIINKESETVCYVYKSVSYGGGISCVPLNQTKISIGESQNK